MIKQIDFSTNSGLKYIMLYDDEYLTEEQALVECEFVGWGGGHDYALFPHYLIIPEAKKTFLKCIKEFILAEYGDKKNDI